MHGFFASPKDEGLFSHQNLATRLYYTKVEFLTALTLRETEEHSVK